MDDEEHGMAESKRLRIVTTCILLYLVNHLVFPRNASKNLFRTLETLNLSHFTDSKIILELDLAHFTDGKIILELED